MGPWYRVPFDLIHKRVSELAEEVFPGRKNIVKEKSILVGYEPTEAREKYLKAIEEKRFLDFEIKSVGR